MMNDINENNKELKSTKWKVMGQIIVAALTIYATVIATWLSDRSASEKELKVTIARQETLLNELNKIIIPTIRKNFDDILLDYKELRQDESAARERIAKLEGILEAVLRKIKREELSITIPEQKKHSSLIEMLGMDKKAEKPKNKRVRIPTLQMQQRKLLSPSLDAPITTDKK